MGGLVVLLLYDTVPMPAAARADHRFAEMKYDFATSSKP